MTKMGEINLSHDEDLLTNLAGLTSLDFTSDVKIVCRGGEVVKWSALLLSQFSGTVRDVLHETGLVVMAQLPLVIFMPDFKSATVKKMLALSVKQEISVTAAEKNEIKEMLKLLDSAASQKIPKTTAQRTSKIVETAIAPQRTFKIVDAAIPAQKTSKVLDALKLAGEGERRSSISKDAKMTKKRPPNEDKSSTSPTNNNVEISEPAAKAIKTERTTNAVTETNSNSNPRTGDWPRTTNAVMETNSNTNPRTGDWPCPLCAYGCARRAPDLVSHLSRVHYREQLMQFWHKDKIDAPCPVCSKYPMTNKLPEAEGKLIRAICGHLGSTHGLIFKVASPEVKRYLQSRSSVRVPRPSAPTLPQSERRRDWGQCSQYFKNLYPSCGLCKNEGLDPHTTMTHVAQVHQSQKMLKHIDGDTFTCKKCDKEKVNPFQDRFAAVTHLLEQHSEVFFELLPDQIAETFKGWLTVINFGGSRISNQGNKVMIQSKKDVDDDDIMEVYSNDNQVKRPASVSTQQNKVQNVNEVRAHQTYVNPNNSSLKRKVPQGMYDKRIIRGKFGSDRGQTFKPVQSPMATLQKRGITIIPTSSVNAKNNATIKSMPSVSIERRPAEDSVNDNRKCPICNFIARKPSELIYHICYSHFQSALMDTFWDSGRSRCRVCSASVSLKNGNRQIAVHLGKEHKLIAPYLTAQQGEKLRNVLPGLEPRPSEWRECTSYFKMAHLDCAPCQSEFLDPETMATHLAQVHLKDNLLALCSEDNSTCSLCKKTISQSGKGEEFDAVQHVSHAHSEALFKLLPKEIVELFQRCWKGFDGMNPPKFAKTYSANKTSTASSTSPAETSISCPLCKESFPDDLSVSKHLASDHFSQQLLDLGLVKGDLRLCNICNETQGDDEMDREEAEEVMAVHIAKEHDGFKHVLPSNVRAELKKAGLKLDLSEAKGDKDEMQKKQDDKDGNEDDDEEEEEEVQEKLVECKKEPDEPPAEVEEDNAEVQEEVADEVVEEDAEELAGGSDSASDNQYNFDLIDVE